MMAGEGLRYAVADTVAWISLDRVASDGHSCGRSFGPPP